MNAKVEPQGMAEYLAGKKTYILAFVGALLAFVDGMGWVNIPEWVYAVIGSGGLAALRAGVKRQ